MYMRGSHLIERPYQPIIPLYMTQFIHTVACYTHSQLIQRSIQPNTMTQSLNSYPFTQIRPPECTQDTTQISAFRQSSDSLIVQLPLYLILFYFYNKIKSTLYVIFSNVFCFAPTLPTHHTNTHYVWNDTIDPQSCNK